MKVDIASGARHILQTLNSAGYETYLVGGCVRDLLRGVEPHGWDICTSALPEETERCFTDRRVIETGLKHGTVTVLVEDEPYEITTYRTEGPYSDRRRPDFVRFGAVFGYELEEKTARAIHENRAMLDPVVTLVEHHDIQIPCGAAPSENGWAVWDQRHFFSSWKSSGRTVWDRVMSWPKTG